jgi:hypothetical protein
MVLPESNSLESPVKPCVRPDAYSRSQYPTARRTGRSASRWTSNIIIVAVVAHERIMKQAPWHKRRRQPNHSDDPPL